MKKRNFCILIFVIVLILSGCENLEKEDLEIQKGLSEISFIEKQCNVIFNKILSDEYIKDNQLDWDMLKEDYLVLYGSINVITIDLAALKISSQDIVQFENSFNELKIYIENQDINLFTLKLCDTYSFITDSILNSISKDETAKQVKKAKSELLYIGYDLMISNKEEALRRIDQFQTLFLELNKNTEYLENNSYKINRIFIDIQRLKSLIDKEKYSICKETFFEISELCT